MSGPLYRYNVFTNNFDLAENATGGGGNGVPTTPLKSISDFDDFLNLGYGSSAGVGKLNWNDVGGFFENSDGTAANPGIIKLQSGLGSGTNPTLVLSQNSANGLPFLLGSGALSINFILNLIALSTNTNAYTIFVGLADIDTSFSGVQPNSGCYFKYTHTVNAGRWQAQCANSGVRTTANTTVTAATGFNNFGVIVNAAANSVAFEINSTQVATITTNIPTGNLGPFLLFVPTAGELPQFEIDLFYYLQTLSIARPGVLTFWPGSGGNGNVVGPASSTNNHLVRWDGLTGLLIKDSPVLLEDNGDMSGVNVLTAASAVIQNSTNLQGAQIAKFITTAISYNVLITDYGVGVTSTAAPRSIVLPVTGSVSGQSWEIKDLSGAAITNNITITAEGGALIDNAASLLINGNFQGWTIRFDGTKFWTR